MLVKVFAAAIQGISATEITIEVNVSGTAFALVGLADKAVIESRERIYSAFKHNQLPFPGRPQVINMAPADVRKEGAIYDLPLAIGMLACDGILPSDKLNDYMIMGELSLDGSLNAIHGALPMAILAKEKGFKGLILPAENAREAAVVEGLDIIPAENLVDVTEFLKGALVIEPTKVDLAHDFECDEENWEIDFSDVKGQESVKRALEVAAAGGHNILMVGPPGAGKSMMSKRFPTILPPLTLDEALETTKIHSVAGNLENNAGLVTRRPFRNPHHTISDTALVGGGSYPQPGEISLAHNGVLFLDELPEFKRSVLEVMRQPLEDRKITVSRTRMTVEYPASFMLVASMNPCPCGYYNDPTHECHCTPGEVQRYLSRISGPLLDRIDMHIEIVPVPFAQLANKREAETSAVIRARVVKARDIQTARFKDCANGIHCNAQMGSREIRKYCELDDASSQLLAKAMNKYGLSARAYDRILKLARTIADLAGEDRIGSKHILEAINYRNLDKSSWLAR
ncbi:MAG: YifB family Mg chelatase-like AAA ATPase [Paludibacteraceae bacterium]|nr:YifB family Mg chelatase-like AAA ATPase [Paludibacteraceae bacterium]